MATRRFIGDVSSDIAVAGNWSDDTLPVATDTIVFDSEMTQAATGTLSGVNAGDIIIQSPAYALGTEASPLQLQTDELYIRNASTALVLDLGSTTAVTANIDNSNNVTITASNASGVLNVNSSTVSSGIAYDDTPTWATINKSSGTLTIGEGATLTTVNSDAGTTTLKSAYTTLNIVEGDVYTEGTGAGTTINFNGKGTCYSQAVATVATVNGDNGGTLDMTGSSAARTVTTTNINGAFTIKRNERYHTFTTIAYGTLNRNATLKLTTP